MAVLTIKNNVNNCNNFFTDVDNGLYYFFLGGTLPWPNEAQPPLANGSYQQIDQSIYHDIVFGKRLTNNNIAFLVPYVPWTNNTLYIPYDQENSSIFSGNSYVVTSTYSVYKCVDNYNNSNSTVQPFIVPTTGCFQTADGYTWKYMYTIPTNANTLFTTNYFIPVVPNTFVTNNAIAGTIDVIRVLDGGSNWQGYSEGYLQSVLNYSTVVINNTQASPIDNFYTGSSIYLKAGLGADQIRPIIAYYGGSKIVNVNPPFDVFVNLDLNNADLTGQWIIGETVSQTVASIAFVYPQGIFNVNNTLIQSDTQISGQVIFANSIVMTLENVSNLNIGDTQGTNSYPIFNTSSSRYLLTGTVTTTKGSNAIIANTANLLTLSVNNYIQVGSNANTNVRRLASIVNSSHGTVSIPFSNTMTANVFYQVNNAVEPTSYTIVTSNGIITQTNLGSIRITYSNTSTDSISYIQGETVKEFNANNVDLMANGIVSFANSSTLILSNVNGVISPGEYLVGMSSTLQSQINNIITYPNITASNALGTFIVGAKVFASYANGVISGSSTLQSFTNTPGSTTEYIIGPTITISGDGINALAYAVVNNAPSSCNEITEIVPINVGIYYSNATVIATANNLYGNGAILYPVISPIYGHGYSPMEELGAKYAGITITIDNAANEGFYFPNYSSYRRIGLLRNPYFQSLYVNLSNTINYTFNISAINNGFVNNEIIYQSNSQAAAQVIYANSTALIVNNINGTFIANGTGIVSNSIYYHANSIIQGLTSGANAYLVNSNPIYFEAISNNQYVYQSEGIASALLVDAVTNNQILLANVPGNFITSNVTLLDPVVNSVANVLSVFNAGASSNNLFFGNKFNQTSRVTLHSNSAIPFQVGEYVNQLTTNATGLVIDTTHELDLGFDSLSGIFSVGTVLTDMITSSNAVITFANNSYMKITAATGAFNIDDNISCLTGNASITNVYNVLVLGDVENEYPFQIFYEIIGNNSGGAIGFNLIANTITYPDLTRNTGEVLYINNISPLTLTPNTKETFSVVISF